MSVSPAVTAICCASAFLFLRWIYRARTRVSISDIAGPEPETFWLGNLRQLMREQVGETDVAWQQTYGTAVRFRAPLGEDRLWLSDPKALQYILQTSRYHFVKPYDARFLLATATGKGINAAEGTDHHRQRRILLPAFGGPETRALMPVFRESAHTLSSRWKDVLIAEGAKVLDIRASLGIATLDALGKAAFEYDFGSKDQTENKLAHSLKNFMVEGFGSPSDGKIFFNGIMTHIPPRILDLMIYLPSSGLKFLMEHVRLSNSIAEELIDSKKHALEEGKGGKDVLTLILKANLSEDQNNKLTDEELKPQLATILGAGHETTTTTMSWILLELASHPNVQAKLRAEILQAQAAAQTRNREPTLAEIDALPYFNAVIKETFRHDTVVPHLFREATRDDILPLSRPITTRSGKVITKIPIPKGLRMVISDVGYNKLQDVWGKDADIYRPERWLDGSIDTSSANVGVLGNLMSFGAGHRACIGWRFALVELQVFLFELIANFEFGITEEAKRVRRENALVMLPMIEGLEDDHVVPLKVSLVE